MSKYIDADKLIAEIERLKEETPIGICEYDKGEENGRMEVLTSLQSTIDSLQQEQPMPDSTQLIEWWHEGKEMLKEKDFRDDPWRLAYNAFMCGFGRGIAVKKQEQQETEMKSPFTGGKVAILSREEEVTFRGEKIKVTRKYYRCEDTGREFTDSKLDDDMMWTAFRAYCEKKGMTSFTDIILKQEQTEVDLEKEIDKYFSKWIQGASDEGCFNADSQLISIYDCHRIARHFYELGLNARKENIVI